MEDNIGSFLIGLSLGMLMNFGFDAVFDYQPTRVYQKSAIEAGVGRYHETTGKFEWIKPEKKAEQ